MFYFFSRDKTNVCFKVGAVSIISPFLQQSGYYFAVLDTSYDLIQELQPVVSNLLFSLLTLRV